MSYPLTGAALSATTVTSLGGMALPVETNPTRHSATVPFSGVLTPYPRSMTVRVGSVQNSVPVTTHPNRQWGLAPTFQVISDSWGIF